MVFWGQHTCWRAQQNPTRGRHQVTTNWEAFIIKLKGEWNCLPAYLVLSCNVCFAVIKENWPENIPLGSSQSSIYLPLQFLLPRLTDFSGSDRHLPFSIIHSYSNLWLLTKSCQLFERHCLLISQPFLYPCPS